LEINRNRNQDLSAMRNAQLSIRITEDEMARLRKQADDESVLLPELAKAILIGPFRGFANPRAITSPGNELPGAQ
jgi:hypothetical protein